MPESDAASFEENADSGVNSHLISHTLILYILIGGYQASMVRTRDRTYIPTIFNPVLSNDILKRAFVGSENTCPNGIYAGNVF